MSQLKNSTRKMFCSTCSIEHNSPSSAKYHIKPLTRAFKTIYEYLRVPVNKTKGKDAIISTAETFCPKCFEIVAEIIEIQKQMEVLELRIREKVNKIGMAISTASETLFRKRLAETVSKKDMEILETFTQPVIDNYLAGLLPNPSVRLTNCDKPMQSRSTSVIAKNGAEADIPIHIPTLSELEALEKVEIKKEIFAIDKEGFEDDGNEEVFKEICEMDAIGGPNLSESEFLQLDELMEIKKEAFFVLDGNEDEDESEDIENEIELPNLSELEELENKAIERELFLVSVAVTNSIIPDDKNVENDVEKVLQVPELPMEEAAKNMEILNELLSNAAEHKSTFENENNTGMAKVQPELIDLTELETSVVVDQEVQNKSVLEALVEDHTLDENDPVEAVEGIVEETVEEIVEVDVEMPVLSKESPNFQPDSYDEKRRASLEFQFSKRYVMPTLLGPDGLEVPRCLLEDDEDVDDEPPDLDPIGFDSQVSKSIQPKMYENKAKKRPHFKRTYLDGQSRKISRSDEVNSRDYISCPKCDFTTSLTRSDNFSKVVSKATALQQVESHYYKRHCPIKLEEMSKTEAGNDCFKCRQCDFVSEIKSVSTSEYPSLEISEAHQNISKHYRTEHEPEVVAKGPVLKPNPTSTLMVSSQESGNRSKRIKSSSENYVENWNDFSSMSAKIDTDLTSVDCLVQWISQQKSPFNFNEL